MKAVSISFGFAVTGVVGWWYTNDVSITSLFLLTYYAVLVLNTFFSIRTFSAITPSHLLQTIFDATLLCGYVVLAFSFNSVLQFSIVSAVLFLVAIGKYIHLKHITAPSELLKRKVRMNALGALLSFSCAVLTLFSSSMVAASVLAVVFTAANVYVLYINPMYRQP